jgi:hypothetical protein
VTRQGSLSRGSSAGHGAPPEPYHIANAIPY